MKKLFLSILITVFTFQVYAQNGVSVTVEIENFSSDKGKVFVALYDSEGNWLNERYKGAIGEISNATSKVTIKDVPEGTYAISMYHDENNNEKLDMNFMGIPSEPIACSNNAKGFFGPPKWEDAKFTVNGEDLLLKVQF